MLYSTIPLAIIYHRIKNPLLATYLSDTNLIKSEFPDEDKIGMIFDPQYFPIKGDVEYPPFL